MNNNFQTPQEALKVLFGYDAFRPGQESVIDSILSGKDVCAIMPTGAGKSVCYQIPAMLLPGITLVISPLISLMQDQVKALNEAGIAAAFINSSLSERAFYETVKKTRNGDYKILYVAPERLVTEGFMELAKTIEISMVTVDEAHCISQWGQDFRPSYMNISQFVDMLEERPVVSAFTATATENVREDIICTLGLKDPFVLVNGFDRENLFFQVEKPKSKEQYILDYVASHESESGIIYCATRKNVDNLYNLLESKGFSVAKYHAGMSTEERKRMQDDFVFDFTSIVVATNAFGMGIDKSNVRYVIHYNMPQSMENYYQEAGRAGRDGLEAKCILLFSAQDIVINRLLLEHKEIITRKKVITARGALMLSDYREVMIAIDRVDGLSYYASIRNLDEETLRDSVLAEFGFAENGEKIYDLGGRQVVISLKTDLSLSIFDMGTGKELKSLPKKGTDEKLYEKAKSDLSDLRRNIKKVISNRKNMLFVDYLEAQKYDAESWKKTYIKNPVLNAVACLVVWQQEEKTFVPTREGKLIDYNGMEIKITATDKIKIAHPIELPEKDVIGWQNYFVNNSLKQPFEQIWEPVYHKEDIRKDRYYGCIISIRRFFGKEKHGISVWGFTPYSYDFGFSLKDCELSHSADLERYIPGVDDDGTYELGDFMIKEFTRYTNHIIYLLDKWTIEGRIEKNDATIGNILDGFTVAQITNFISLALEKKSTASLAVLMDYKNKKFTGYDSMQEFTLD